MEYSGVGEKLIHEKNEKQKISWHCPFKVDSGIGLPMANVQSWNFWKVYGG